MDEFAQHWDAVNTDLGSDVTLQGGYDRDDFIAERDGLAAINTSVIQLTNVRQIASVTRDTSREAVRERIRQFRAQVQTQLAGSGYVSALPELPRERSGEGGMLEALDDASHLWTLINADVTTAGFTPPLLLAGGYDLATFNTDITGMRTAFQNVRQALKNLQLERNNRDNLLEPARERMKQYQTAVEANLPAGHALLDSVPRLSPLPGSTPDAVTLSGSWDASQNAASLSWTESTEPNLDHYELRMTPGDTYDSNNDQQVGNFPPGTLATETTAGVSASGLSATFRLFVVLTTGNEKGSTDVTVQVP